jgi:hypothetical protein
MRIFIKNNTYDVPDNCTIEFLCEPSPTYDLRRRSEGFLFFRNGTSLPLYGLVSVPLGCPNVK